MRVITNLTVLLYSLFFFVIGVVLILTAFNFFSKDVIMYTFDYMYSNTNMRLVVGTSGAILVTITLLMIQLILGKMQREKTIAFDNPDGQVTISLGAIEDFIKRLIKQIPEIKELKPTVIANKKGVNVMTRLILYSDTNIPDVTERIQGLIRGRVQEILGIEETISVKAHIIKIVAKEDAKIATAEPKDASAATASYRGIEY